jgi:hypothetical protein
MKAGYVIFLKSGSGRVQTLPMKLLRERNDGIRNEKLYGIRGGKPSGGREGR